MLTALIVIYNKYCCDSVSFNFVEKFKNKIDIILFDNSTKDYNNKQYCEENNIKYYSLDKNVGLSKAYNYVLNDIKLSNEHYLLILDDDTILNEEFFDEVFSEIIKCENDVLLPIVKSNNQIISPSNIIGDCRVKGLKKISDLNMNNVTAINSGMVVRTSIYSNIKYNEDMFLDYVDHEFMRNVRKNNFKIKILNSEINQNFSRNEKQSIDSVKFRFNIYRKDYRKYCEICNNKIFYYLSIIKLRIVSFIKYRRII